MLRRGVANYLSDERIRQQGRAILPVIQCQSRANESISLDNIGLPDKKP
jgi:hypothetical protein